MTVPRIGTAICRVAVGFGIRGAHPEWNRWCRLRRMETPELSPAPFASQPQPLAGTADGAPLRRGATLELTIEDLAFGGKALAKVQGLVVFVENALPGDRVLATVTRRRRQYAEARAVKILEPSPARVPAPCSHVPICGGCRFQDFDYPEQLRHKQRQVEGCLEHLGGIHAAVRPVLPALELFHYRNKMEYSFGRDEKGALTLGLHRRGFYDKPFDLERCFIATPISSEIVVLNLTRRKAQIAVGEEERLLAGKPTILEELGGLTFEISSNSFFQTNTKQAERLLDTALEALALGGSERVLDVYSGTGTFTLPLAKRAAEAIGIESSAIAVRDAERNAARNGIRNAHFWTGEALEVMGARLQVEGFGFDAVLVDPPRAGLHPGVIQRLLELGAPRLVYVSCNPSTLGRDLGLLCESRYAADWIQPVDMFPHTPHIECVAALRKIS